MHEIRPIEKRELEKWDHFVENSIEGTVFHKSFSLCHEGYEFEILALFSNDEIIAGMPLTITKRFGLKLAINPPLTPYLGIIFGNVHGKYCTQLSFRKDVSNMFAKKVRDLAPYVKYGFSYRFNDFQPFIWNGFSCLISYTYTIDLRRTLDEIVKDMDKSRRNDIKYALSKGVQISNGTSIELIDLVTQTFMRKKQKPPYDQNTLKRYIEKYLERKKARILVARIDDDPVAAGAIVFDCKQAHYVLGGIDHHAQEKTCRGAASLVQFELIKCAKNDLGLEVFDFEGSMNPDIELFFRKFGGTLTPKYTIFKRGLISSIIEKGLKARSKIKTRLP